MSKSYKPHKDKLGDEIAFNLQKQALREHRKEKRLINAMRSKKVDDLIDLDDEY